MTKEQLIETVKERVTTDNIELHSGYIEQVIAAAFNQLYYVMFKKGLGNLDLHIKEYTNQIIQHDNVTDEYYVPLAYPPVQLASKGHGILRVGTNQGRGVKFVPSSESSSDIFYGLESSKIPGLIGYIVYKDKIVFDRNPGISKIKFNMLRWFQDIGYDETIYIPAGQDEAFLQRVVQFIMNTPDDKKVNDNNPKTP